MWILHDSIKTNQYKARSSMFVGLLNNLSFPIIIQFIQSTHLSVMI